VGILGNRAQARSDAVARFVRPAPRPPVRRRRRGGAWAQQPMPLVVVLMHGAEGVARPRLDALREGLQELGCREKQNYRLEVRYSDNRVERLRGLARELLVLKPQVAVANIVLPAQALHRESKTIPIVMAGGAKAARPGDLPIERPPGST
jgi:hypothetical protein